MLQKGFSKITIIIIGLAVLASAVILAWQYWQMNKNTIFSPGVGPLNQKESESSNPDKNNIESPDKVVSNFYACYLKCVQGNEYKGSNENPGDFCIKKCDGLSENFKQHLLKPVEGVLADRIIWASDVPGIDAVTVGNIEINSQEAFVFINFLPAWPDHWLKVSLKLINGQWKISNVEDKGGHSVDTR